MNFNLIDLVISQTQWFQQMIEKPMVWVGKKIIYGMIVICGILAGLVILNNLTGCSHVASKATQEPLRIEVKYYHPDLHIEDSQEDRKVPRSKDKDKEWRIACAVEN